MNQFERTERLLGAAALAILKQAHVAVFGVGGVGGYVCEALVRSGVGAFDLIDNDVVSLTNLNRQIIATHSTLGAPKVDVMRARMLDINPDVSVRTFQRFVLPENIGAFPFSEYDYIVDAVDTVTAKIALAEAAAKHDIPVISSMGAAGKLDPTRFRVMDLFQTTGDPLARVMRRELRKRGVTKLKVVCSDEAPIPPRTALPEGERAVPGSIAFVPSAAGLVLAGAVIRDLIGGSENPSPQPCTQVCEEERI